MLPILAELADQYNAVEPWLALSLERVARRFATQAVLEQLPPTLSGVIAQFEAST